MTSELGAALRDEFPILSSTTYLNSAAKGALSSHVRKAMIDYLDSWDRHGAPWERWLDETEGCRVLFARLIHARPDDVFLSGSVSAALGALIAALHVSGSDEILVLDEDFPTIGDVALGVTQRLGGSVRFVPVRASGEVALEEIRGAVTPRTRAVIASAVHHAGRTELSIDQLAVLCRDVGVVSIVDAYHAVGAIAMDVSQAGVDALVTGSMKYLLGSAGGLALAYCNSDVFGKGRPLHGGWLGTEDPFATNRRAVGIPRNARKFETGLPGIAGAYAAAAGLRRILSWGPDAIEAHVRQLVDMGWREFASRGLTHAETAARRAGPMICLRTRGEAAVACAELAALGVVVGSWREWLRLSFHAYNTEEDVASCVMGLERTRDLLE